MLLRSSSTPVLGSLLSSFSESPNNCSLHHDHNTPTSANKHHYPPSSSKISRHGSIHFSCNSSPISHSMSDTQFSRKGCFRRAQSEGNLEELVHAGSSSSNNKELVKKNKYLMREEILSFSFSEDDDEEEEDEIEGNAEKKESEKVMAGYVMNEMRLVEKNSNLDFGRETEVVSEGLFLARGLGIDNGTGGSSRGGGGGGSGGGGREFGGAGSGGDGEDNNKQGIEEYYKRLVNENPSNSLIVKNYAQFLYEIKQDLKGAEEYYSRAILLDPNDGDTLAKYAKLMWQLYRDEDRALLYFEQAVQASAEDSHVHAAYASFLWEVEEDEEDVCNVPSVMAEGEGSSRLF